MENTLFAQFLLETTEYLPSIMQQKFEMMMKRGFRRQDMESFVKTLREQGLGHIEIATCVEVRIRKFADNSDFIKYFDLRKGQSRFEDVDTTQIFSLVCIASELGDLDLLRGLIQMYKERIGHPSQVSSPIMTEFINHRLGNNTTLLMRCHSKVTKYLLEVGADPTVQNTGPNTFGNTAFHWAAWYADVEKINAMLQHDPSSVHIANRKGETMRGILKELMTGVKCEDQRKVIKEQRGIRGSDSEGLNAVFQEIGNILDKYSSDISPRAFDETGEVGTH
jgi:hypothetical protein